jgi:hypothetical protein
MNSMMYARRVGQQNSEDISQYRDQIFHLSQAALCRELENFSPRGTVSVTLLQSVFAASSRWIARILYTLPHELSEQTFQTTREDLKPIRDSFQSGFQPNYPFPSRTMPVTTDDSTISSGSTSTSTLHREYTQQDFVPGFPVESSTRPETPVQNTIGNKGQPTILIDSSIPDTISDSATTIPLQTPLLTSDQTQTLPVFDPLRLLSPLEKDCPRLQSTSETSIRNFIAFHKEYRRAGGNNCLYCINDLISIDVRKNLRMSSVQDPYALRSDEESLSFLILRIPKLKLYLLLPCNMRR